MQWSMYLFPQSSHQLFVRKRLRRLLTLNSSFHRCLHCHSPRITNYLNSSHYAILLWGSFLYTTKTEMPI